MHNRLRRKPGISRLNLLIFLLAFSLIGIILLTSHAAPNPNLPGDLDGNNKVDSADLAIMIVNYNTSYTGADINQDGTVDGADFSKLLTNYGQSYSGGGATISGASTAVCATGACKAGTTVNFSLGSVSNDDGTYSTRDYSVYRPGNLTSSQSNLAPAVFLLGGGNNCAIPVSTNLNRLADASRFIVVEVHYQCTNPNLVWGLKYIAPHTYNDEPYITAVANAVKQCPASGANIGQCADPQRMYMIGASSGAQMSEDVMCSNENSSTFRGYGIDSAVIKATNNTVPVSACPSSDSTKPTCASIGQQNCFNRRYFLMAAAGTVGADAVLSQNMSSHLVISDGTVTGTGAPTTPTSTYADWAAQVLGCGGSSVKNPSYKGQNYTFSYNAPCSFATSGKAIYTISIHDGAHYWNCQDSDPTGTYYSANPGEPSNSCPTSNQASCPAGTSMPNPPGLDSTHCYPLTGGWGFFPEFWDFVSAGFSH